ncbi:unknown [Akkermansia muciniphila CAG:154]|nr:unknown [Akkermansia muciniphila CAG:154]
MRVVRFLIQPIWSRRASFWAVPSALTVLPAAAAMERAAREVLPDWMSFLTASLRSPSCVPFGALPRLFQSRLAPASELAVLAASIKAFSVLTMPVTTILPPSVRMPNSW